MATSNQINDTAQLRLGGFDVPLTVPVHKLDADQYSADDLDGVTESLFGSGNMAYASLQASQTDAMLINNEPFRFDSGVFPDEGSREPTIDTDRPLETGDGDSAENLGTEGHFSNATVGSLGASTLSSDVGAFSPSSNLSVSGENFFGSSSSVESGIAGGGGNATSIDASDHSSASSQTTNTTTNQIIDNSVDLGDEITEIINGDTIGEVLNTVHNEINDLTENLSTTVNNVTDTVNNVLNEFGGTEIVDTVTNITNNVTETVTNIVDDVLDGGLSLDLDLGALDTLGTGLGVVVEDSIAGNLDVGAVSGGLADLAGDLTGLDIPLVTDLGVDVGFDLLGGENVDDGNDVSIGGLATPDLDLDLVEDLVGDIDLSVDLPEELLDPGTLVDGGEDLVGSLGDLDLADPGEALDLLGGEGVDGALDIVAGDTELGEDFDLSVDDLLADLPVDDAGLEDALGLLDGGDGEEAGDAVGALPGGDEGGWTETTIDDVGGLFDDVIGGIGGETDALPDPSGTVGEGLGILDTDPDVGSGGGLFGGGLFG